MIIKNIKYKSFGMEESLGVNRTEAKKRQETRKWVDIKIQKTNCPL